MLHGGDIAQHRRLRIAEGFILVAGGTIADIGGVAHHRPGHGVTGRRGRRHAEAGGQFGAGNGHVRSAFKIGSQHLRIGGGLGAALCARARRAGGALGTMDQPGAAGAWRGAVHVMIDVMMNMGGRNLAVMGMRQTQGMADFVNDGMPGIVAGLRIGVIAAIGTEPDIAALLACAGRIGPGRARQAGLANHDFGIAGTGFLDQPQIGDLAPHVHGLAHGIFLGRGQSLEAVLDFTLAILRSILRDRTGKTIEDRLFVPTIEV